MKRKYYLRGLGIGILVTAVLFAFGLIFYRPELSESEIRAKAIALGMVDADDVTVRGEEAEEDQTEEGQTAESGTEAETETGNEDGQEPSEEAEQGDAETAEKTDDAASPESGSETSDDGTSEAEKPVTEPREPETSAAQTTPPAQTTPAPTTPPAQTTPAQTSGNRISATGFAEISIIPGDTSLKAAEKLYRAGIISDPNDFNTYLEQNGFDNFIQPGSFRIQKGADYETIAHAISSK